MIRAAGRTISEGTAAGTIRVYRRSEKPAVRISPGTGMAGKAAQVRMVKSKIARRS